MQYFEEINSVDSLFLHSITEASTNLLIVNVEVGITADYYEDTIVGKARPVIIPEDTPRFEIRFEKAYVAYQVSNESFTIPSDEEQFEGRFLRVYSKSYYMDYTLRHTTADFIFPNEMKHYCIICQNHVIDVISFGEPTITQTA